MLELFGRLFVALWPFLQAAFKGDKGLISGIKRNKFVIFSALSNLVLFMLFIYMVEQTIYLMDRSDKYKRLYNECNLACPALPIDDQSPFPIGTSGTVAGVRKEELSN